MYLQTDAVGAHAPLGEVLGDLDKGGMAVGESDAPQLLKILEGRSSYQPYLKRAMAQRATTLPKHFLRIVTSVSSQVPRHLQRLFVRSGGRMVGGTIDRWTRTIYMVPAPGLRFETRLEYALHECVHLFAHPHAPTQKECAAPCVGTFQRVFGKGFGEGLTQVITEDIMAHQQISQYYRDRPYESFAAVMREVVKIFGRDALARAYFFGETQALAMLMDARWGTNRHAVAGATNAGDKARALRSIAELEAAYKKRLEDLIRNAPKGDFPTPTRERMIAGAFAQEYRPMYVRVHSGVGDPAPAVPLKQKTPPFLVFSRISPFAWNKSALTPQLKQQIKRVADYVRSRLNTSQPIGVVRLVGHTDGSGGDGVNRKFGNYRAEIVRDELRAQLRDVLHRVLIEASDESPGKAQPVGSNSTAAGRALNRRVDVYVAPPIPPAEPWPQGPTIKDTTVTDPDPDWDKFRFKRGMPDPLDGKSVREILIEKCRSPKRSKGTCEKIVDTAISLGCKAVESLMDKLGNVGSDQKEEIKKRCKEGARKSM